MFDCNNLIITQEKAIASIFINTKKQLKKVVLEIGERCRELIDAADEITRRLYNVVDWMFEHPEYNPKTKVIPKKDYPVLVDVTF